MKISILVPVYNEGKVFEHWFPKLMHAADLLEAKVVVVDDASAPPLSFPAATKTDSRVVLLRHEINCGVGAAIATGLEYAKKDGADLILTIDGDGQHDPMDLLQLVSVLERGQVDVVNGSRFLKMQFIPLTRRIANFLGNMVTLLLSGFWVSDSQSGMKGFSKKALEKLEIRSAGYEWCSDVFREMNWHGLRFQEVPISVFYSSYTLRKGQNFAIGIDMVIRLAIRSLWK